MSLLLLLGIPGGIATGVIDTTVMQLPINCILASNSLYKRMGNENEIVPFRMSENARMSAGKGGRLSKNAPTFTTKTSSRGYD